MIKVLYFSRNGNSKRVAEKIAQKMGSHVSVLTDDKNWKGPFGYIKGGYYASSWKVTQPTVTPPVTWDQFEYVIIVSPLWASNVAPAVYSLLLKEKALQHKVVLVLTNDGSDPEIAFKKIESHLGEIPYTFGITKRKNNEEAVISEIVKTFKK